MQQLNRLLIEGALVTGLAFVGLTTSASAIAQDIGSSSSPAHDIGSPSPPAQDIVSSNSPAQDIGTQNPPAQDVVSPRPPVLDLVSPRLPARDIDRCTTLSGNTSSVVLDGHISRTQDIARPQPRPTPPPAAPLFIHGAERIDFPANPAFHMTYTLRFNHYGVPISTTKPTGIINAELQGKALGDFSKGQPTIVQFRGFRNACNQYTTTEIWVRPRGQLSNQVIHYRVNSPMTLTRE